MQKTVYIRKGKAFFSLTKLLQKSEGWLKGYLPQVNHFPLDLC